MTIEKNRIIIFVLMIASVMGVATWLSSRFAPPEQTTSASTIPDAYMEGITATIMDQSGEPHIKVVASKLIHFSENDTSQVTSPKLTLFRASFEPWLITANYARMKDGIDEIYFWDDVVVHHNVDHKSPETTIKTSQLTVHTQTQQAETSDMITFMQPNLLIKSIGMTADIKDGHIQLLSQAEAEYLPDST